MSETISIAGRRFPVVALVCPIGDHDDPDAPRWDLSLGAEGDNACYIPAENGVLFQIEPYTAPVARPGTFSLHLVCVTCERSYDPNDGSWVYLPRRVALVDGQLRAQPADYLWDDADPDWVVETIDRVSRLPFEIPDGPRVEMVPPSSIVKEDV